MKYCIRIICILSCLIMLFSFSACDQKAENAETTEAVIISEKWNKTLLKTDPSNVTYTYSFESVEDLLSAIKHDPDKYDNASVKVIGTIYIHSEATCLLDFTMTSANARMFSDSDGSALERFEFRKGIKNSTYQINLVISNTAQNAVIEEFDYVKVYGTVKLQENNIHIIGEYDLIATADERIENINDQK